MVVVTRCAANQVGKSPRGVSPNEQVSTKQTYSGWHLRLQEQVQRKQGRQQSSFSHSWVEWMNDLLNKVKRADALIKLNLIQHYRCPPIAVHENQLTHLLLIVWEHHRECLLEKNRWSFTYVPYVNSTAVRALASRLWVYLRCVQYSFSWTV